MPTVQRHTERTSTSLKSGSITAAEANRIFGAHALSSAQLGTIIGGTIDAQTKIAPHAIGSTNLGTIISSSEDAASKIAAKTLLRTSLTYLVQTGSAFIGFPTAWVAFPIAYAGGTPSVTISQLGSIDYTALAPISGSAYVNPTIMSVDVGSFSAHGTPGNYYNWIAQGSA